MQIVVIKEFKDVSFISNSILEHEFCLVAHPDLAPNYGLGYYLAMQKDLQLSMSNCKVHLGIACSDLVSFALEAIAGKVNRIYFLKNSPYWLKIDSVCHKAGTVLYDQGEFSCLW